jgi:hypothetical protein
MLLPSRAEAVIDYGGDKPLVALRDGHALLDRGPAAEPSRADVL